MASAPNRRRDPMACYLLILTTTTLWFTRPDLQPINESGPTKQRLHRDANAVVLASQAEIRGRDRTSVVTVPLHRVVTSKPPRHVSNMENFPIVPTPHFFYHPPVRGMIEHWEELDDEGSTPVVTVTYQFPHSQEFKRCLN